MELAVALIVPAAVTQRDIRLTGWQFQAPHTAAAACTAARLDPVSATLAMAVAVSKENFRRSKSDDPRPRVIASPIR